jgi:hypothetical protein
MKYDEFCLVNFYAHEVLESLDMGSATKKDIHRIEKLLFDNKITPDHFEIKKLITYDYPKEKALLIEKDPMLQKAHYIIISNLGFEVTVAKSKEEVITYTKHHYDVVFTRPYQNDLSGILSTKLFTLDNPKSKIFLYITPEEKEMSDYFSHQGADVILELPLNSRTLFESLS